MSFQILCLSIFSNTEHQVYIFNTVLLADWFSDLQIRLPSGRVYHGPTCPNCSSLYIPPPNGPQFVSAIIHPEVFKKDVWIFRTCGQGPIDFVEKYLNCSHKLTCALREGGAAIPPASFQCTLPSDALLAHCPPTAAPYSTLQINRLFPNMDGDTRNSIKLPPMSRMLFFPSWIFYPLL